MPIGLVALLFIILQMPALKPTLERKVSIDWWGSVTLLVGIVPLLLALSLGGQEFPWGSWQVIGLFALARVGVVAFILVERRAKEPILPFDLFQNRTYVIGNAAALLIAGVAFFGAILFLPDLHGRWWSACRRAPPGSPSCPSPSAWWCPASSRDSS